MRKLLIFGALLIITSTSFNCKKKELPYLQIENDTIVLKHVNFEPGVTSFKLSDTSSVYLSIYKYDCYYGPHLYTCSHINIKSTDTTRIKLSYGGHNYGNLSKDSIIDSTLFWCNTYLSGGWVIEIGEIGYRSEYVGIKYTDGNHVFYGWIHTPTSNIIIEYAIDTMVAQKGNVRAGQIKKY